LADDVESFILERDLYVRPVAVVGVGLGADVAVTLVARNRHLVGAVALVDFSLEALELLDFFPLQAGTFAGKPYVFASRRFSLLATLGKERWRSSRVRSPGLAVNAYLVEHVSQPWDADALKIMIERDRECMSVTHRRLLVGLKVTPLLPNSFPRWSRPLHL
jgi:pimeloyl-ACP methyl ester carboxylesterase